MNNQQFNFLDFLTILGFCVGAYALEIGLQNLVENRSQSKSQKDFLQYLEEHLKNQDDHLKKQDELIERRMKNDG